MFHTPFCSSFGNQRRRAEARQGAGEEFGLAPWVMGLCIHCGQQTTWNRFSHSCLLFCYCCAVYIDVQHLSFLYFVYVLSWVSISLAKWSIVGCSKEDKEPRGILKTSLMLHQHRQARISFCSCKMIHQMKWLFASQTSGCKKKGCFCTGDLAELLLCYL